MNAEEGSADAEHVAQDATSNNVEDRERRGILIAPLCRKLCRDGMHFPEAFSGAKSVKLSKLGVAHERAAENRKRPTTTHKTMTEDTLRQAFVLLRT